MNLPCSGGAADGDVQHATAKCSRAVLPRECELGPRAEALDLPPLRRRNGKAWCRPSRDGDEIEVAHRTQPDPASAPRRAGHTSATDITTTLRPRR